MMNAYVYQAALYCEECGRDVHTCDDCRANGRQSACRKSGDSHDYPQGPYPDGGGEADTAQHCDACHVFLENPLTTDGLENVSQACFDFGACGDGTEAVVSEWAAFYDCLIPDPDSARWDRFDICLAHYVFACEYYTDYSEQCKTLAQLERVGFKPGLCDSTRRLLQHPGEQENAINILARLVRNQKAQEVHHV